MIATRTGFAAFDDASEPEAGTTIAAIPAATTAAVFQLRSLSLLIWWCPPPSGFSKVCAILAQWPPNLQPRATPFLTETPPAPE
jgi:hypothetical protein